MESRLYENELTLRDLLNIFKKRRRMVYASVAVLGVLSALYCAVCTRRYQSVGTIQVQKTSSDGLGLDSITGDASGTIDASETNVILQTQASILQSDTLALRTIKDLRMEGTEDFQSHWNPIGWVFELLSSSGTPDTPGLSLEDSPARRTRALKTFSKNLKVVPTTGTNLIEIDYTNPDPKLSAAVVNDLMQGVIDFTFQTRFSATNQASSWLTGQLSDLRKQSEDLQSKVVDLERQSGVYSLGMMDAQGREQAYSGVLDQLQQSTTALAAARQNRILKGAVAQAAESGDAEMLSGLSGNSMTGGATNNNTLALIQTLRQQEATQQAVVREAEAKYGSSYPKLTEMRANLAGIEHSIQEEVNRIKGRAESDSAIATQEEAKSEAQYELAKQQADKLNDKAIKYAIVKQEAVESRELYEDLLKRLKEAGVLEGLKSSNITVVDPGRVPAKPKKPNVPLYLLAGLGGGFFLGCLGALFTDTLDNKISDVREVEQVIGQTVLGTTPRMEHAVQGSASEDKVRLAVVRDPQSAFAESLRSIRTSILLTGGGDRARVILVTSSVPGEGKTELSSNLAAVIAQSNRRVLLVDADMRRSSLQMALKQSSTSGLSEFLAGQEREPKLNSLPGVARLDILQSGKVPPNPSELLDLKIGESILEWRKHYDFIVVDGPPLLPVTDAQIIHPFADITLLIARNRLTTRTQLQRSYRLLTDASKHFVGVIVNGVLQDEYYCGAYEYGKNSNRNSDRSGEKINA